MWVPDFFHVKKAGGTPLAVALFDIRIKESGIGRQLKYRIAKIGFGCVYSNLEVFKVAGNIGGAHVDNGKSK